MKRILWFVVVAFILATGSACKNGPPPRVTQSEITTINFAISKGNAGVIKEIITEFEMDNPDIRVNFVEMSSNCEERYRFCASRLSGGDKSVDIYCIDDIWVANFAANNYIMPLSRDEFMSENNFLESIISSFTIDNQIYAAPFAFDVGLLYYRKDIVERVPDTWEDIIKVAQKHQDNGEIKSGFALQSVDGENMACNAIEFIQSAGDNASGLETYKTVLQLNGYSGNIPNEYITVFKNGEALFTRAWASDWKNINDDISKVKGKVGVTQLPLGRQGAASGVLGAYGLAVNINSEHVEQTKDLIKYITTKPVLAKYSILSGTMPVIPDLYDDPMVLDANPWLYNMVDKLDTMYKRPKLKNYVGFSLENQRYITMILSGEADAHQVADNIILDPN